MKKIIYSCILVLIVVIQRVHPHAAFHQPSGSGAAG